MKETVAQNYNQRKSRKNNGSKIEYVIVGFCVFAVLMFIVSNYVELARLTTSNSRLKTQIETLKGDEQSLKAKYEQTFNLVDIETKAKGELGMIKMDKTQLNYIELSNPDKLSTAKAKEEVPQIVQNAIKSFNIVVEYLN